MQSSALSNLNFDEKRLLAYLQLDEELLNDGENIVRAT